MKSKNEVKGVKIKDKFSFTFQHFTPKNALVLNREVIDYLFDYIDIGLDNVTTSYTVKQFTSVDLYNESKLHYIYENHSIFMNFYFRNNLLPKRCEKAYESLSIELYDYLKLTNKRVSRSKVRATTKHLIKHISRLKYHKSYTIKYPRKHNAWENRPKFNASHSYMMSLIDMLQNKGSVSSISGYIFGVLDKDPEKVSSLLIVNPNFIEWCNGYTDETKLIKVEDCLLEPVVSSIEIRVRTNPKNKKEYIVVKPEPKDNFFYAQAKRFVDGYNEVISERIVEVDGRRVPELFFRRIFTGDMEHGARFYDRGEIQGKNKTIRSTIYIDGSPTVERDFSALHYSLCAEKEGLDLKGKDPYDFPFECTLHKDEIEVWKQRYNIEHKYDPVRNLKKIAMLTMFNANDRVSASKAIYKKIRDDFGCKDKSLRRFVGIKKVDVNKLIDTIIDNNSEVSKYFNSGIGLHLQFLDSNMIEHCISRFLEIDEVCLPVHDSLIVKESLSDFAEEVMREAYLKVMGSNVNCRIN